MDPWRNMTAGAGKVVCVTGASGYIASWLVKLLLERGYTVRAAVRNSGDPLKTDHLKAFKGAEERLHLFSSNLNEDGCFDSVVDGCDGVFHTASPVPHSYFLADPQAELVEPAVKGTLNVLRSCSKAPTVKRVVLTSSMAAMIMNGKPRGADIVVDETWFSDPEFCRENKQWYPLSKILAEQAAWKFAQENGIDLVVLNPSLVIGPLLQPTLNSTSGTIMEIIKGNQVFPYYRFVDVRDVALGHILAFEDPTASGRYCLTGASLSHSKTLQILHRLYPSINAPAVDEDNPTFEFSMKRAETLGISFTPFEVSIKDIVESLKAKNFLTL